MRFFKEHKTLIIVGVLIGLTVLLTLILYSCVVNPKQPQADPVKAQLAQHEADIKALVAAKENWNQSLGETLQNYITREAMGGYATKDDINNLNGRIDGLTGSSAPANTAGLEAELANLQAQVKAQQTEIDKLKAAINSGQSTPQPPDAPVTSDVMTVTVTKATASVTGLSDSTKKTVDFAVKMVNLTNKKIDNIIIRGYIECNRDLYLADGYPLMKDTTNNSLLFAYQFDGSSVVDFEFYESTGSPTVYLNPSQSFIFHPQLVLLADGDYAATYTFTLHITDFEVGG